MLTAAHSRPQAARSSVLAQRASARNKFFTAEGFRSPNAASAVWRPRRQNDPSAWLKADLQDLTVIAYEPARMLIRKSDGPVATRSGYGNPSDTLIGSKSSFS
jgi:hypothetical protein